MRIWEVSLNDFLLVTVFLAGGAAWLTGRATARVWAPYWKLLLYIVLLTVAARFIHFSLFGGTFFLPFGNFWTAVEFGLVDFVILIALASLGRRMTRSRQMATQYGFLFDKTSPFSWRQRA